MDTVFERFLPLLHPYMPHVTEELWEKLGFARGGELLMRTQLPESAVLAVADPKAVDSARKRAAAVYEATTRARNLKAEYNLAAKRNVRFVLIRGPGEDWVEGEAETLRALVGAEAILCGEEYLPAAQTPTLLTGLGKLYMPLEGLVDTEAERARLEKELARVDAELKKVSGKLNDANFTERAPKEVIDENKRRREEFKGRQGQLQEMLANLG